MKNNKTNNFKKIIKENYKLIIPIALMIVLFAAFLIYYKIMISNNFTKDETINVYQYFYGKKYEYELITSKNRKDVIVNITPKEIEVNYDSTPIYFQDKDVVIFPKNMSIVMPTLSCAEYLSKSYSYITYENNLYNLTTEKYNQPLKHYFFYDGNDLYFLIEPATLIIGDKKIELSPLSYIIAKYNKSISYYDKKTNTFKTIETDSNEVLLENNYYSINIIKDTINYQGTNIILTSSIENLMTIDQNA